MEVLRVLGTILMVSDDIIIKEVAELLIIFAHQMDCTIDKRCKNICCTLVNTLLVD